METRYNTRSPAVKRLMREAHELCEPTDQYFAQPLEDDLFEWHFTIRGPADTDFQTGVYHGRIILPVDYPMKPPSIIWLTPNGRFETNKKICLSISGHHPESWQPSWSIRTALLAIIGFMPTHPGGAIGSLDYKPEERKALAKKSRDWKCSVCGDVSEILLAPNPESSETSQEAKDLAAQISFQGEKPKGAESQCSQPAVTESQASTAPPPTAVSSPGSDSTSSPSPPGQSPTRFPAPWPCFPNSANPNAAPPPLFPYPWTYPMMPPGQNGSALSQVPRFPYPPSHYANTSQASPFYPPGYALPPGVGMFPCPFPPPPRTVYNTSTSCSPPLVVPNSNPTSQPLDSAGGQQQPTPPGLPADSSHSPLPSNPAKENVLNELLGRVKRQGSDQLGLPQSKNVSPQQNIEEAVTSTKTQSPESAVEPASMKSTGGTSSQLNPQATSSSAAETKDDKQEHVQTLLSGASGSSQQAALDIPAALQSAFDSLENASKSPELNESKVAQSGGLVGNDWSIEEDNHRPNVLESFLKEESANESTDMDVSQVEMPVDGVSLSESSGQKSQLARNTSFSTPDLPNDLKAGSSKGLRQRQSATARVPTEDQAELTISEQGSVGGHRIEAVAGDSSQQNAAHNVHAAGRNTALQNAANGARAAVPAQTTRDPFFIAMYHDGMLKSIHGVVVTICAYPWQDEIPPSKPEMTVQVTNITPVLSKLEMAAHTNAVL